LVPFVQRVQHSQIFLMTSVIGTRALSAEAVL
jgi:hypothetical protein